MTTRYFSGFQRFQRFHRFQRVRFTSWIKLALRGSSCLLALTLLPSCLLGDLKDMHNDTHQMAGETKDLVKKTGDVDEKSTSLVNQTSDLVQQTRDLARLTSQLSGKMTQVSGTTDSTFLDLRQGNSLAIRDTALKTMEKAKNMPEKLDEAAQYFQAMEFQLWRGQGSDTDTLRDSLYLDAFRQFFYDVQRYAPHGELDIAPTSMDPSQMNLNALAATMHIRNVKLELMARQTGHTADTILSLIEKTLQIRPEVNSGEIPWESLHRYQREILENADLAVYMLRLRTSFIPVLLLSKISNINDVIHVDAPLVGRLELLPGLNGVLDLIRPFDAVGLRRSDIGPLERDIEWIDEANREYDFLENDLRIPPRLPWIVRRLYVELRLPGLPGRHSAPSTASTSASSNASSCGAELHSQEGILTDDPNGADASGKGQAEIPVDALADQQRALHRLISGIQEFRCRFQDR